MTQKPPAYTRGRLAALLITTCWLASCSDPYKDPNTGGSSAPTTSGEATMPQPTTAGTGELSETSETTGDIATSGTETSSSTSDEPTTESATGEDTSQTGADTSPVCSDDCLDDAVICIGLCDTGQRGLRRLMSPANDRLLGKL